MVRDLVSKKKEILAVVYLVEKIESEYSSLFSESNKYAFDILSSETKSYGEVVSESSFSRLINYRKKPFISYGTMNNVVRWFTRDTYMSFIKYVDANEDEINEAELISEDELNILVDKITNKKGYKNNRVDELEVLIGRLEKLYEKLDESSLKQVLDADIYNDIKNFINFWGDKKVICIFKEILNQEIKHVHLKLNRALKIEKTVRVNKLVNILLLSINVPTFAVTMSKIYKKLKIELHEIYSHYYPLVEDIDLDVDSSEEDIENSIGL